MQITFNSQDMDEVKAAHAFCDAIINGNGAEAPTYLPEDQPAPAAPVAPETVAQPEPAAAPAAPAPEAAAPAAPAAITLDIIKAKVNEINLTDNAKLVDVKAALDAIGVDKTSNLQPGQFDTFWTAIKDLV